MAPTVEFVNKTCWADVLGDVPDVYGLHEWNELYDGTTWFVASVLAFGLDSVQYKPDFEEALESANSTLTTTIKYCIRLDIKLFVRYYFATASHLIF